MSPSRPSRRLALLMLAGLAGCAAPGQTSGPANLWGIMAPADPAHRPPADPSNVTFALEIFTGGPGNVLDNLAEEIALAAKRADLTLAKRTDPPATFRIAGHMTAIGSDQGTYLTYVIDVLDAGGTRVYRFVGSEPAGGTDGDPWGGIDESTLAIVAERVVETLKAWLHGARR